jgi:ABC-type antimicrobial peptide transport system permease subunit
MEAAVSTSIREPRFRAIALSLLGAIACAIAGVGLAGALAWLVRSRQRELGIRLALGADPRQLRSIVVRRGLMLAGSGVALGLAGASLTARFLRGLVYGITPTDVPTFGIAAAVMLGLAIVASLLPARKASSPAFLLPRE